MAIIYGVPVSPFVRKVMLAHAAKGFTYELKPTPPGSDNPEFQEASPFGKIPGYRTDDGFGFSDSSVIVAYIERLACDTKLYPQDNNAFAKALWLEEYADTKLMEATAGLYFQNVIGPNFFEHQTDEQRVAALVDELIPAQLDYVESQVSGDWLVEDQLSIADIAIGSSLINLTHTEFDIDATRWPKTQAYFERLMTLPYFQQQLATERAVFSRS